MIVLSYIYVVSFVFNYLNYTFLNNTIINLLFNCAISTEQHLLSNMFCPVFCHNSTTLACSSHSQISLTNNKLNYTTTNMPRFWFALTEFLKKVNIKMKQFLSNHCTWNIVVLCNYKWKHWMTLVIPYRLKR